MKNQNIDFRATKYRFQSNMLSANLLIFHNHESGCIADIFHMKKQPK